MWTILHHLQGLHFDEHLSSNLVCKLEQVTAREIGPIWLLMWSAGIVIGYNFGGIKPIDLTFLICQTLWFKGF